MTSNLNFRKPLAVAIAALGLLSLTATNCTDLTIEPKSTLTDANVFNDPEIGRAHV